MECNKRVYNLHYNAIYFYLNNYRDNHVITNYIHFSKKMYVNRRITYADRLKYSIIPIETLKQLSSNKPENDEDGIANNIKISYFRKREKENKTMEMEIISKEVINNLRKETEKAIIKRIKEHFGITLEYTFSPDVYRKFLIWLKKYDKNFKNHIDISSMKKVGAKSEYILGDVDFIIKVDHNTYARIMTQTAISKTMNDNQLFSGNCYVPTSKVRIYIFGKETFKVAKLLNKISTSSAGYGCYTITSSSNERIDRPDIYYNTLNGRKSESIFLNDHIKESIINHINKFFNNKEIYEKRNLNYKTGILLYGEPGTGKTTIANMIATEYNCDMILINMSEFVGINTDFLTSSINSDDLTYVIVLEDIDCVIGDRESKEEDLENKKNVNKLLQFLDSTSSPSNVIFIATTNHIEKLDDALLRDGRFDLIVNVTNITKEPAINMCKSFGITDNEKISEILNENMVDGKINPAKLQNLILQEIDHLNN